MFFKKNSHVSKFATCVLIIGLIVKYPDNWMPGLSCVVCVIARTNVARNAKTIRIFNFPPLDHNPVSSALKSQKTTHTFTFTVSLCSVFEEFLNYRDSLEARNSTRGSARKLTNSNWVWHEFLEIGLKAVVFAYYLCQTHCMLSYVCVQTQQSRLCTNR